MIGSAHNLCLRSSGHDRHKGYKLERQAATEEAQRMAAINQRFESLSYDEVSGLASSQQVTERASTEQACKSKELI
jgi:hypothetical protein